MMDPISDPWQAEAIVLTRTIVFAWITPTWMSESYISLRSPGAAEHALPEDIPSRFEPLARVCGSSKCFY